MNSEDKKPRTMSPDEQARILSLPIREFAFGSVMRKGHFDEEAHKFYFVNNDGSLEGKVAKVIYKDQPPDEEDQSENEAAQGDSSPPHGRKAALAAMLRRVASGERKAPVERKKILGSDSNDHISDAGTDEESIRKKKVIAGTCIAVFIILLVAVALPMVIRSTFPTAQTPPNAANDPSPATDSSLEELSVIQVTRDMIPGDILSADVLQSSVISAADYNSIYLSGSTLYQWTRVEDLLLTSNYVTEYIPRGLYLTYENVSGIRPQTNNPWMPATSNYKYVLVPLPDEIAKSDKLSFGVGFDALIQITSQTNSNVPQGEDSDIDGMKISTITEKAKAYTIADLIVCDILNGSEESLYQRYHNLMAVPSGEQLTFLRSLFSDDASASEQLLPKYIKIRLTNAQAHELGNLTDDNVTLAMTFSNRSENDTDAKLHYTEGAQALLENIRLAIRLNEEATAQDPLTQPLSGGEERNGT